MLYIPISCNSIMHTATMPGKAL